MSAAFVTAPAERPHAHGRGIPGRRPRAELVLAALAFGAYRVRALLLPGWSGAPARLAEAVLAVAGLICVSRGAGHLRGVRGGRRARRRDRDQRRGRPDRRAGWPPPAACDRPRRRPARRVGARKGDRRARLCRACRRLDGADPGDDRRRHGPRRQPLVPHAARGAVRADGLPRPHLLLRPGLSGLVLPRELRGPPRGRDPVLRPRHRLAVLNLGWLSVALLAAWCIGRPYGVARRR